MSSDVRRSLVPTSQGATSDDEEEPHDIERGLPMQASAVSRGRRRVPSHNGNLAYFFILLLLFLCFSRSLPATILLWILVGLALAGTCLRAFVDAQIRRERSSRRPPFGLVNPLHFRLGLVDRDFTPEDYDRLLVLDDDSPGRLFRGAAQGQINTLPSYRVQTGQEDGKRSCSICLETVQEGDDMRILPCLHQFHVACVDEWLRMQATCPVCKYRVF